MVYDNVTKLDKLDIIHDEGREAIHQWREKRLKKMAARKSYLLFYLHTFNIETLQSFLQNFNFMVVFQMLIAGVTVYLFQTYNISFDLHVTLFVSPIVFPLAFSIDADFQRREKVLEDLAQFKSSGMVWYFCMRDWKQAAGLDNDWISAVQDKLRSVLFHLREYLLTYKPDRRKIILHAMYEDFSDMNQLIEKLRASDLPSNTAIISRAIHLLNMMCLSFERLRVVREYRSPRSIRSFNKVLIMVLPIILAPYYVYLGNKTDNKWEPYYISILVAFVFSALQGVQDKLDDPFDGMSEDDINLDSFDEWNSSLEHTMKRTFAIGRFKVSVEEKITKQKRNSVFMDKDNNINVILNKSRSKALSLTKNNKYFGSLGLGVDSLNAQKSSIDEKRRDRRVTIQTDRMRPILNETSGRLEKILEPSKTLESTLSLIDKQPTISQDENNNTAIETSREKKSAVDRQCQTNERQQSLSHSVSISEPHDHQNNSLNLLAYSDEHLILIDNVNNNNIRNDAHNNNDDYCINVDVEKNACCTSVDMLQSIDEDDNYTIPNYIDNNEDIPGADDDDLHTVMCEWNILDATLRREMFANKSRLTRRVEQYTED